MAYLETEGEFEKKINRGGLSFRSKRLDNLVAAVNLFVKSPRRSRLLDVQDKLNTWKQSDPKEFANRGASLEQALRGEITQLLANWGQGEIRVIDPAAHPRYEPAKWNDNGWVQFSTNCYAYACNDSYHHIGQKPQPGQIAGRHATSLADMQPEKVRYAVMADDLYRDRARQQRLIPLVRLRNDPVPDNVVNVPGYYLIALVTAPNADYHWVRQDNTGMWSHKPGWSQATDLDSDGEPIYDPRDAVFRVKSQDSTGRLYWATYTFTTFYYAPRGGVRTGDLGLLPQRRASI